MGLMNSALQIGRNAILSYQSALQVVGSNISSVGSPDYTRLTPQLDPLQGPALAGGMQPGAGVALTGIQRNLDETLEARIRLAIGEQESLLVQQSALAQTEALFENIGGTGVVSRLTDFFNSFDNLQNTPEDLAVRGLTITQGTLLAESLHVLRGQLAQLGENLDQQVADLISRSDGLAQDIAGLNEEISRAEAGVEGQATGLRDQRDALLRELSEIVDVSVQEQPDGALNVYIGSEALVQGNFSRGLIVVTESDGEFTRSSIRFADDNAHVNPRGGRLEGLVAARDEQAYGRIQAIDELTAAIIAEVNRIHADGQGLSAMTSVTGSYDLLSTDAALNSSAAGLPFPPENGSFYVTVTDEATGTPVAYLIDVNLPPLAGATGLEDATTLESLVADINAQVQGAAASITSGNRLSLTADDGYSFTFGHDGQQPREDTSGVLAALGINTFFTGRDARDIAVNEVVVEQPALLSSSSIFLTGDGTTAGRIAGLATATSARLGGETIAGFYNSLASSVAVTAFGVNEAAEAASAVRSSLQAQKESVSGVSLDEEAIALLKFQRAFQGASRFVSVVDDLLKELIALIR